jgi:hypothetical protein
MRAPAAGLRRAPEPRHQHPLRQLAAGRGGVQQAGLEDGADEVRALRRQLHAGRALPPRLPRCDRRSHRLRRVAHAHRQRKEAWVFDIDETSLSNLPYYATHGFGYEHTIAVLKGNSISSYLNYCHHFLYCI